MASDLHLPEAVTPTAALNGLSANAGDPQVLFAPDPGPSPDAGAFGQQLRDASAVSLLPGFASPSQVPEGVSETGVQKKDASHTDWNGFYLPVMPMPAVTQVVLPLNFALPASGAEEQPRTSGAPSQAQPQPQNDPELIPQPALLAQSAPPTGGAVASGAVDGVSAEALAITPGGASPLTNAGEERTNTNQPLTGKVTPASADNSGAVPDTVSRQPGSLPKWLDRSLTVAVQNEGTSQSGGQSTLRQRPLAAVTDAKPDAPVLTPATTQTQPPTATDATPRPSAPVPGVITSIKPDDLAPLTIVSQQPAASPETPAPARGTLPVSPKTAKGALRPMSSGVRSGEATAPKDVSQPPGNWTPAVIPRSEPLDPIAPSSPNQRPAANLPPTPAGVQDTQRLQPQPETVPQVAGAPIAQPVSGELTFAVKVTPQETADSAGTIGDNINPLVTSSASQVVPVKEPRRTGEDGQLPNGAPQHEGPLSTAALPVAEKPAAPLAFSVPEAHAGTPLHTNPAVVAQMSRTSEAKPVQPVKQLSIQVGQEGQQKVELRVVERSGELQVAVRAANPDLAQGLRQGLSDLVGRLEQSGFHADAWRPGATPGTAPAAAERPQTQAGPQNDNSQSQSHWSQQDRQQGNHNPSRRPQWVEELEKTSAGSRQRIPGETYGISR